MKKFIYSVIFIVISFSLLAAPSLMITESLVTDIYDYTGPTQDPDALHGQWFKNREDGAETYRTHEFYDNVDWYEDQQWGGGGFSFRAIQGYVSNIIYGGPAGEITAFDISVTITNDTPAYTQWADGSNSHDETLALLLDEQYEGTLFWTKLTAEFAVSGCGTQPPQWTFPYIWHDDLPQIMSENHDQLAWYCWTPDNPWNDPLVTPFLQPWGDYFVPTWDFGHIPRGGSAQRFLNFFFPFPGITEMDPRYIILIDSYNSGQDGLDIFHNRTTSLKISTWMDDLAIDTGIPYPEPPLRGSDVSVFHNDNIDNPLPVHLSSFYGTYINGTPTLYWETASESDNIGWNVYRANSSNLGQAAILNLNTIPGNGTTTEPSYYSFVDEYEVQFNFTYWYWIESISVSGETEMFGPISLTIPLDDNDIQEVPIVTELYQNFPNPFNPNTSISFDIEEGEIGIFTIYNLRGQLIEKQILNAGEHKFEWDGTDYGSGVYLYKLETDSYIETKKMLMLK